MSRSRLRRRFAVGSALVPKDRSRVTGYVYKKKSKTSRRTTGSPETSGKGVDVTEKQTQIDANTQLKWEIFRKISYAIVTQTDIYELPPDWDDTIDSPTWDNNLPDPSQPWFRQERVHEIGYITDGKQIIVEKMYVPTATYDGTLDMELSVIVATSSPDVPPANRIPNDLLSSSFAQDAIATALSEV